jgi:hypothetical protein
MVELVIFNSRGTVARIIYTNAHNSLVSMVRKLELMGMSWKATTSLESN